MILTKTSAGQADLEFLERERILSGGTDSFILIVPTNRKSRFKKKEIINASPGQSTGRINVETITTFTAKVLFDGKSEKGRLLTEAASAVLLKQSFAQITLRYFSKYKNGIPAGTINRIKNVISEYKKHGITPGVLRAEIKNLSASEKLKAEDIADVYEIYRKKCRELNVFEIGDIYENINSLHDEEFRAKFRRVYPKVNLIVVSGFDEFTSPEIEIINKSAELKGISLFVGFDYYRGNDALFSHLDQCYDNFILRGFREIQDLSPVQMDGFHRIIRESLFNKKAPNADFRNKITVMEVDTRSAEAEIVAREIKELILVNNVKPEKIAVVFNLIQNYSDTLRDVFDVYGIPYNLTDRYSLAASQPVISVINFLEILEHDFFYKNIFRALSGGYVRLDGVDLSNLLKVSVNLKIISGLNSWRSQIRQVIRLSEDDDNGEARRLPKGYYEKAAADIESIYKLLTPFIGVLTIDQFKERIKHLLFLLEIPVNVLNSGGPAVEKNVKAVTFFIEIIDEMFELLKLEYGSKSKFNLQFFLDNIRTALSAARYNVKEKPGYGVQVTTLNEIRGLKFDYLFIAGLCDGDMPTRYQPEIFFSGKYARKEARHQNEERYLFYQSLCSWQKHLYLTYPTQDERSELSPSLFIKDFCDSFAAGIKKPADYKSAVYSLDSLIKLYGGIRAADTRAADIRKHIAAAGIKIDQIDNSIYVSGKRQNDSDFNTVYSGSITEGLTEAERVLMLELKSAEYSTTQLEGYAGCPYQYFAQRILRLEPPEEPAEELESLELGSLLHNILYEFYSELKRRGIKLSGAGDSDFRCAEELLFGIAREKIENMQFSAPVNFFEKEKILGAEGDKTKSILYMFLNAEREAEPGFDPDFFETSFGRFWRGGNAGTAAEMRAGDVKVRGKIDRIDLNREEALFKVIDYKLSGKKISADDLMNGISLQLPLYMYAAKELIKAELGIDAKAASGEIYSLKFNSKNFGRTAVRPVKGRLKLSQDEIIEANEKVIEICIEAVNKYVGLIAEGKFNLSRLKDRDNKVCTYCSFKPICRIKDYN